MHKYFQPKTPFTALKAVGEGLLPAEAYIYMATSIEPIADNPDNLAEIERILGQKDRDLETNLLLISILSKFLQDPDKEKALFAAESINAIENRYNRELEELSEEEHEKRARIYTEMAELNKAAPDLRNFYLREAFSEYRFIERSGEITNDERLDMCRILIKLGLLSQAKSIITDNEIITPEAGFMLADIAFRQKNYADLFEIIRKLDKGCKNMDSIQSELTDFWMGKE